MFSLIYAPEQGGFERGDGRFEQGDGWFEQGDGPFRPTNVGRNRTVPDVRTQEEFDAKKAQILGL